MPFWRFIALTAAGSLPWVLLLAFIGREVGDNWDQWRDHLRFFDYGIAVLIVAAIAYYLFRRWRGAVGPRPAGGLIEAGAPTALSPARALPWRAARARPSCCRFPARRTSRSSLWLLGWDRDDLDRELRKSFEVALHAGAAAALVVGQRRLIASEMRLLRRCAACRCSRPLVRPAAIVGYSLEPRSRATRRARATVAGLLAGSVAMVLADLRPQERGRGEAGAIDGLASESPGGGLDPGRVENGAMAAAAGRGASPVSRRPTRGTVALQVIVGATVLKGVRLRRRGGSGRLQSVAGDGDGGIVCVHAGLAGPDPARRTRPRLWPYAAYRVALAASWRREWRDDER